MHVINAIITVDLKIISIITFIDISTIVDIHVAVVIIIIILVVVVVVVNLIIFSLSSTSLSRHHYNDEIVMLTITRI